MSDEAKANYDEAMERINAEYAAEEMRLQNEAAEAQAELDDIRAQIIAEGGDPDADYDYNSEADENNSIYGSETSEASEYIDYDNDPDDGDGYRPTDPWVGAGNQSIKRLLIIQLLLFLVTIVVALVGTWLLDTLIPDLLPNWTIGVIVLFLAVIFTWNIENPFLKLIIMIISYVPLAVYTTTPHYTMLFDSII